jgi:hypothetical protein
MIIRPIYAEPSSYLQPVIKSESLQIAFKRLGGEEAVK